MAVKFEIAPFVWGYLPVSRDALLGAHCGCCENAWENLVPVAAKLLPTVQRRVEVSGNGPIFGCAANGGGASFGRIWLKKVKKIDPELTMHGFRHYAASEMENHGISAHVSALILGHVRRSVHDSYVHPTVGTLKEAVDTIR